MKVKDSKLKEIESSHTLLERGKVVSKGEDSGEGVDCTLVSNTLFDNLQFP